MQVDKRQYDGAGRVVRSGSEGVPTVYYTTVHGSNGLGQPNAGNGFEQRFNRYDANGRIQHQTVRWSDGSTLKHDINYQSYDAAGNLLAYTLVGYQIDRGYQSYGIDYTYNYLKRDGYQERTVGARVIKQTEAISRGLVGSSGNWHDNGRTDATTTSSYDRNGHLIKVSEQAANSSPAKVRTFINNADGVVVQAIAAGKTQRQLVAAGEVLGRYDQTSSNFHFGYQAVGNTYPANTPVNWVVAWSRVKTGPAIAWRVLPTIPSSRWVIETSPTRRSACSRTTRPQRDRLPVRRSRRLQAALATGPVAAETPRSGTGPRPPAIRCDRCVPANARVRKRYEPNPESTRPLATTW